MKSRGFTMIEVLVASALTALVLIGLNTLIFSMAELWGRGSPTRIFDLHTRAVTTFLTQELQNAAFAVPVTTTTSGATTTTSTTIGAATTATMSKTGTTSGGQVGSAGSFAWQPPLANDSTGSGQPEPLLTFTLPAGNRLLPWPARALPDVVCAFEARSDGLYILWHSEYEVNYAIDPPHETLITPLVTAISYDYFDPNAKTWTTQTEPMTDDNGNLMVPGRLRFTFTYQNLSEDMAVILPAPAQGLHPY